MQAAGEVAVRTLERRSGCLRIVFWVVFGVALAGTLITGLVFSYNADPYASMLLPYPLAIAGLVTLLYGGRQLARALAMMRTPTCAIDALAPGRVEVVGQVVAQGAEIEGPDSGEACVYLSYARQESRVSKGKTRWQTVERREQVQPFELESDGARVRVDPGLHAPFKAREKVNRVEAGQRHIERRLDPGETVYLIGECTLEADGPCIAPGRGVFFYSCEGEEVVCGRALAWAGLHLCGGAHLVWLALAARLYLEGTP